MVLELPRGIFVGVFFLVRVFLVGVFFLLGSLFFFFYWQVYGRFSVNWDGLVPGRSITKVSLQIQCAVDTQWSASNLWLNTPLWTGDCVSRGYGSSCMVPGHAVMQIASTR